MVLIRVRKYRAYRLLDHEEEPRDPQGIETPSVTRVGEEEARDEC